MISSGESIRACLAQILRDGGIPLCVACIVDGRPEPLSELILWDRRYAVISLLSGIDRSSSVEVTSDSLRIRSPSPGAPEESTHETVRRARHLIGEELFEEIVSEQRALALGHTGSRRDRHFTAYLNLTRLKQEERIRIAFLGSIDEWKIKRGLSTTSTLEYWYPSAGTPGPEAAREVVRWISVLRSDTGSVRAVPISRGAETPVHARLPGAVVVSSSAVVALDWGAFSGRTIMELISLAASSGVRSLYVGILVSHLAPEQQAFFEGLESLKGSPSRPRQADLFGHDEEDVEVCRSQSEELMSVHVVFGTVFGLQAYSEQGCPVCEQLRRLASENHPTELLERFRRQQEEVRLRLRSPEEVQALGSVDLDGREMSAQCIRWILAFRRLLSASSRSTLARREVSVCLTEVAKESTLDRLSGETTSTWLLRLLAVETQWLRRAPLRLSGLRKIIATIATRVSIDASISEEDRLNAAIVLRTSSKVEFGKNLEQLLLAAEDNIRVAAQVLYGCFTYVLRPYLRSESAFAQLSNSLQKAKRSWQGDRVTRGDQDVPWTIEVLSRMIDAKVAHAGVVEDTPAICWSVLRTTMLVQWENHSLIPGSFSRMLPHLYQSMMESAITSGRLEDLPSTWLRNLRGHWELPLKFLDSVLIPRLRRISPVLDDPEIQVLLGVEGAAAMKRLVTRDEPLGLSELSQLVEEVADNPYLMTSADRWRFYCQRIELLDQVVFSVRSSGGKPSRLIAILERVPADAVAVLRGVVGESEHRYSRLIVSYGKDMDGLCRVFATEDLVASIMWAALDNCETHALGEADVQVEVSLEQGVEDVTFVVVNKNTGPEGGETGRNLALLGERVKRFGGNLSYNERNDEWSFELRATFARWPSRA